MPVGSEFMANGMKVKIYDSSGLKCIKVEYTNKYKEIIPTETWINAKFIPIAKPVSFMEAIKAYRENKKISCELGPNKYTYEFSHNGIRDEIGRSLTSDKIINGKWYIEE